MLGEVLFVTGCAAMGAADLYEDFLDAKYGIWQKTRDTITIKNEADPSLEEIMPTAEIWSRITNYRAIYNEDFFMWPCAQYLNTVVSEERKKNYKWYEKALTLNI